MGSRIRKTLKSIGYTMAIAFVAISMSACGGKDDKKTGINPYYPGGQMCPPNCGIQPPGGTNLVGAGLGWNNSQTKTFEMGLQFFGDNYSGYGSTSVTAQGTLHITQLIGSPSCPVPTGRFTLGSTGQAYMGQVNISNLQLETMDGSRIRISMPLATLSPDSRQSREGIQYSNKIMGIAYIQSVNGQPCYDFMINLQ